MKLIEERARLAARQIFEEIGLSKHSIDKVSEIIAEKLLEQREIDTEKACNWITEHIDIPYEGEFIDNSPVASDYIKWCEKRLEDAKAIADAFKQAMEE